MQPVSTAVRRSCLCSFSVRLLARKKPKICRSSTPCVDIYGRHRYIDFALEFTYFHPKFILGLTATPERSDGEDMLELFQNVAPIRWISKLP